MYSVTKKIEFCYGHRLLDYDGICKHPHGHNAVAEIEVRTDTLDGRNMVCDFSDIKRVVKGWIDAKLDHQMILRKDDPLVKPLQELGEPIFLVDSNPTVELIARTIYDQTKQAASTSCASPCGRRRPRLRPSPATDAGAVRLRSRRHARRLVAGSGRRRQRRARDLRPRSAAARPGGRHGRRRRARAGPPPDRRPPASTRRSTRRSRTSWTATTSACWRRRGRTTACLRRSRRWRPRRASRC